MRRRSEIKAEHRKAQAIPQQLAGADHLSVPLWKSIGAAEALAWVLGVEPSAAPSTLYEAAIRARTHRDAECNAA